MTEFKGEMNLNCADVKVQSLEGRKIVECLWSKLDLKLYLMSYVQQKELLPCFLWRLWER